MENSDIAVFENDNDYQNKNAYAMDLAHKVATITKWLKEFFILQGFFLGDTETLTVFAKALAKEYFAHLDKVSHCLGRLLSKNLKQKDFTFAFVVSEIKQFDNLQLQKKIEIEKKAEQSKASAEFEKNWERDREVIQRSLKQWKAAHR